MNQRFITQDDLLNFEWLANPVLDPSGKRVVYETREARRKQDDYTVQLVLADVNGTERRVLTSSGTRNTSPVWSPDGENLAFLSNRLAGTQVWILPMSGGEAKCLTFFRHGVNSVQWTPDGNNLVLLVPVRENGSVEVFDKNSSDEELQQILDAEQKKWQEGPKHYDWMYYKDDGVGLSKGFKRQLVIFDLRTRAYRQLTEGLFHVDGFAISPDGAYVAFSSNRREQPEIDLWSDLYRVPFSGGEPELLCQDVNAGDLSYSPDGKEISFFGNRDEYKFATHIRLYTIPAVANPGEANTPMDWTADFQDTLGDFGMSDMRSHEHTPPPVWSPDGNRLFALASREGRTSLVCFHRTGTDIQAQIAAGGDREIYGFSVRDSVAVLAYTTALHPGKIVSIQLDNAQSRPAEPKREVTQRMNENQVARFPKLEIRLDDGNDALLDELLLVEPEPFWYTSEDNWQVQGFVMKPADYKPGQQYPVLFEIHGGPHAAYSYSFFHELQWFAANGYAVVFVNPRGSASYGQEFVNACRHDYGGKDAADLLNGLDAALRTFEFLDASRVAVTGGSYGGFMTNWLVGHTHRFFAAVSQRSITNWISFYGVSDIGPMFTESEMGADVMNGFETLWRHSPLAYTQNVKTPLLLIHSEQDLRCPIEQAEQFYTCLRRQGNDVELMRVPDASHDLSRTGKPSLRLARLEAMLSFIQGHLPNPAS